MDERMEEKLIACLDALEAGQSVEEILEQYPADAASLGPFLLTAQTLTGSPPAPTAAARRRSKDMFLNRAATLKRQSGGRPAPVHPLLRMLRPILVLVLLMFLSGAGLVAAANNALPGDLLYATKLEVEQMRLNLAPGPIGSGVAGSIHAATD
jgi:hypothetical protein